MKRLFVVANLHHASPRIPALTDHLVELGWSVTILSAPLGENPSYRLGFPEMFMDRVRVIEVPYPGDVLTVFRKLLIKAGFSSRESFTEQIKEKFGVRRRYSWVDRALWLYQEIFAFPDGERTWRIPALKAASMIMANDRFDIILSSSPYPTSHVIACSLQKEFKTKWVADFRDTWTMNPVYPYSASRQLIESKFEKHILQNASSLITVSDDYANSLRDFHYQTVCVIPNGYQGNLPPISADYQPKKFILTYTGSVYLGQQAPEKPLKSIKHLIDKGAIKRDDIEVHFYGRRESWIQNLIDELDLSDVVIQYGQIPRQEARQRQHDSALLLFFNWEDKHNKGLSHLKFYEYLCTGRLILATGGHIGSDIEYMLNETRTGFYARTEDEIEQALVELYSKFKQSGRISYEGKIDVIARYSYHERAQALNSLLCSLDKS